MDNCIFCQIAQGKLPSYQLYEDEEFLTFLDIYPLNPGHAIVIPKKHYRWVYDVPNFGKYWEIAKKAALAAQNVVKSPSLNFLTLGYQVAHAHIHVIPRFDNDGHDDGIRLSARKKIAKEKMAEITSEISKLLQAK